MRADRQRNDDAIIRAAARLLAVDPAASTQAIADAAGVARLTVYRSFPTREALEGGVRAAVGARVNAALGAFAGWESGTEALRALVGALVLVGVTYPVALLRHRVAVDPGPFDTRMITLFRDGQRAGVLREDVPAETLNAALFAVLFAVCGSTTMESPERVAETVVGLVLHGAAATVVDSRVEGW